MIWWWAFVGVLVVVYVACAVMGRRLSRQIQRYAEGRAAERKDGSQ